MAATRGTAGNQAIAPRPRHGGEICGPRGARAARRGPREHGFSTVDPLFPQTDGSQACGQLQPVQARVPCGGAAQASGGGVPTRIGDGTPSETDSPGAAHRKSSGGEGRHGQGNLASTKRHPETRRDAHVQKRPLQ
eukprot:998580-Prorocentrum_minimum.AAC.2